MTYFDSLYDQQADNAIISLPTHADVQAILSWTKLLGILYKLFNVHK